MKVPDFDFYLPENLIAKRPLKERDNSRLLVLHRDGKIEHRRFSDLPSYLDAGDMLLVNNTKVFPARLIGFKPSGGRLELLLVREKESGIWEVLTKGWFTGTLKISEELSAELYDEKIAHLKYSGDFMDIVWKYGSMPLPPYIKRQPDESDKERYQTVYAKKQGSIAAPTAGLHFTDRLLKEITSRGIMVRELTLHVGTGTFRPIKADNIEKHYMDPEYFEVDINLISEIEKVKNSGKRLITVGTTTTRAIEGYVSGQFQSSSEDLSLIKGYTDIFIYPSYEFKAVDSLITNFHLPRSTPLMLTSALCGYKKLMESYTSAIARGYRFFSYGDAMLIL
ncbi:MAG: tRNA preQ1(34) S-adenosylmethionine ribosyltransferase-isomerase QueA [Nitrospirae bacterium]|nr:tRNA preQ1(34) S-adenosylmethionine ribosyltransferase-isomerase QueA [Nitrospirota bacterium]